MSIDSMCSDLSVDTAAGGRSPADIVGSDGALSGVLNEFLHEFGWGCASSTSRVPLEALLTFSHSFLSNTACITNRMYIPSNNDVVHGASVLAWLHSSRGDVFGSEWVTYNVGGSRSRISLDTVPASTPLDSRLMLHMWVDWPQRTITQVELLLTLSSDNATYETQFGWM
ncbi:hypothetical protein B0H14DRAFT_3485392 [Mycena olivaceomarginata]|nr:hypothetical protein B0H14DRAFT_3485392 [Mycena olivaceomarginata]